LLVVGSHGPWTVGVVYGRWMKLAVVGSHGLWMVGVANKRWTKLEVVGCWLLVLMGKVMGKTQRTGKRPMRLLVVSC